MNTRNQTWDGVAKVLGFEPKDQTKVLGHSGQLYEFSSLALDEKGKRVLLVSNVLDPQMASLIHWDIVTALKDYRVLTARQVTMDFQSLAMAAQAMIGTSLFNLADVLPKPDAKQKSKRKLSRKRTASGGPDSISIVDATKEMFGPAADYFLPFARAAAVSEIGLAEHLVNVVRQAAQYDWPSILRNDGKGNALIDLQPFLDADPQQWDRDNGICPLPIYELTEAEIELCKSGNRLDEIGEMLVRRGIRQYFEPPFDHSALALVDRGLHEPKEIERALAALNDVGHPIGDNELLEKGTNLEQTLQGLKDLGYVAEGEQTIEITATGQLQRATIKFRPREAAITKVLRLIGRSISTKGWFQNININLPK